MADDVAVPGTNELGDGIAQIRLPMTGNPLRYINGYAIEDAGGLTLVDCGWKAPDVYAALVDGLRALGRTLADVRRILITHHHFDHYGLAATLRRAGVPQLYMHPADWNLARTVEGQLKIDDDEANAWLERNGYRAHETADDQFLHRREIAEPTRLLEDGERVGRLEAVWTPGHAPGHLCFVDTRSGRILTGDHILNPITPHVGLWRGRPGDPMGDYLASLRKVQGRGLAGALPAHGEPFRDVAGRVEALLEHAAQREGLILAALATGATTAGDVARRLPWTRRNRTFDELGEWHRQFAMSETIAHLHHLAVTGRAERSEDPSRIRYKAAR